MKALTITQCAKHEAKSEVSGTILYLFISFTGLQNDRKAKMAEMEQILALIHEMNAGKAERENNGNAGETVHRTSNDPFVQVDKVMPNSPAEESVITFLHINYH